MDGCSNAVRKQTIRSAGRNRVMIPKRVLNRAPQGETLSGLDSNTNLADGSTDGIQRGREPQQASKVSRRKFSEAKGRRDLSVSPFFCQAEDFCVAFLCMKRVKYTLVLGFWCACRTHNRNHVYVVGRFVEEGQPRVAISAIPSFQNQRQIETKEKMNDRRSN